MTKKKWQKGAVLAFTALILPMIVVGTGLAVDLGNIYVQYSRLQNAADAAVLAGAHEFAAKNEKMGKGNHPKADGVAEKYIKGSYHNLEVNEELSEQSYAAGKAENVKNTVYYRVKLTKEVPLYFLGSFYEKIKGKRTFTVPVISVAAIHGEADNGGYFNNLFIFKDKFSATNSIENPDKLDPNNPNHATDSKNMITTTFDGHVVYTKGDGKNDPNYKPQEIKYSTQANVDRLFTTEGKKYNKNHNINELVSNDESKRAKFDKDGTLKNGYWSQAEYYNYNFQSFYDFIEYKRSKSKNESKSQDIYTSSSLFNEDFIYVPFIEGKITNPSIYVDETLGNSDKPIYVYIAPSTKVVNISLSKDTGRPLIICIGGSENQRRQVHLALNGHTFKGVIYAPYCDSGEGVLVNANNGRFIGTIVGASINLQGGVGYYEYKDFIGKNSGSDGSSSSSTDGIALASPPDSIKWD